MKPALLLITATLAACASKPARFEVNQCHTEIFLDETDCDKGEPPRRLEQVHCVVMDRQSGCKVGAVRERNPDYMRDIYQPQVNYVRVYDWECPAGVTPPSRHAFRFVGLYVPVACDPLTPIPTRNPLLHKDP